MSPGVSLPFSRLWILCVYGAELSQLLPCSLFYPPTSPAHSPLLRPDFLRKTIKVNRFSTFSTFPPVLLLLLVFLLFQTGFRAVANPSAKLPLPSKIAATGRPDETAVRPACKPGKPSSSPPFPAALFPGKVPFPTSSRPLVTNSDRFFYVVYLWLFQRSYDYCWFLLALV